MMERRSECVKDGKQGKEFYRRHYNVGRGQLTGNLIVHILILNCI